MWQPCELLYTCYITLHYPYNGNPNRNWGQISAVVVFRSKGKGSQYSITERRVPELIPVLGSQPAGDVSHKPGGRLPLLSARPAVTLATLMTLLPISLLGEQRHDGCEQFAQDCNPTASRLRFAPGPSAPESSTIATRLPKGGDIWGQDVRRQMSGHRCVRVRGWCCYGEKKRRESPCRQRHLVRMYMALVLSPSDARINKKYRSDTDVISIHIYASLFLPSSCR